MSILKFNNVSFSYQENRPLLEKTNFSIRRGAKVALMGQNGSGKTTLFKLLANEIAPDNGNIIRDKKLSIGVGKQMIQKSDGEMYVDEFLQSDAKRCSENQTHRVLDAVHLQSAIDKRVKDLSGGQKARLLVAKALIEDPDILLLDEPTNNLDKEGIEQLSTYLRDCRKTCVVISHDTEFLNGFVNGILYLDSRTQKIEQYKGNYLDALESLSSRIKKESRKNTRLKKAIQKKKEKANVFAHKGGSMRKVAKKLRQQVEELEVDMVDVRKDDIAIKSFHIPMQRDVRGRLLHISSVSSMMNKKIHTHSIDISLYAGERLLVHGPNGIGKSTFLNAIFSGTGVTQAARLRIGYYRQDFSSVDYAKTAYELLAAVMHDRDDGRLRSVAAHFLITNSLLHQRFAVLSEGQKALVAFASLVLSEPGMLLLDEPTNHINFRHIPAITDAINTYEGGIILVSHMHDFVDKVRPDKIIDLKQQKTF